MTDLHADSLDSRSAAAPAHASSGQLHRWMEAYVDGDEQAFERLHGALQPRLRSRLSRLVRDPAVVDDLVQLTFLRAHAARDRLRPFHWPVEFPELPTSPIFWPAVTVSPGFRTLPTVREAASSG